MIPEKEKLRPYDGGRLEGRYIRLPRCALTWGLAPAAALAYGLLLDRAELSARNGWRDPRGLPYINYSLGALSRDLGVSESTAKRVLAELEGNGLLRRVTQRGKAARLYPMVLPNGGGTSAGGGPSVGSGPSVGGGYSARYGTSAGQFRQYPPQPVDSEDVDRLWEELQETSGGSMPDTGDPEQSGGHL